MAVAVVTGGASGIGRAVANALTGRELEVRCWDRTDSGAGPGRGQPEGQRFQQVDVADAAQIEAAFGQLDAEGVSVDVLVSCAGIFEAQPFDQVTAESWDRTMTINLRGAVLCAVQAAKRMVARGGRIVLVASTAATASEPHSTAYSASKAALAAVTRSSAVDLARLGVAVNAVAPGWVSTGMTRAYLDELPSRAFERVSPLARPAEPEEIAGVVVYLCLDAPPYMTGATVVVDGGQLALAALPG